MADSTPVPVPAKPKPKVAPAKSTERQYVVLKIDADTPALNITRIDGTFAAVTDAAALDAMLVANPKLDREGTYVAIAERHYTPRKGKIETTTKGLDTITKHLWT